jgi:hypothetical protein
MFSKATNNLKEKYIPIECTQNIIVSNVANWMAAHSIRKKEYKNNEQFKHKYRLNQEKLGNKENHSKSVLTNSPKQLNPMLSHQLHQVK